jgi:hypothetical protein
MIVVLILIAWWALCAFVAWALCRSADRADATAEKWAAERLSARDALESMGAECEIVDFGGWRNRGAA